MAGPHYIVPTGILGQVQAVRLGATAADRFADVDIGKFVKLAGESQYNLAAAGDPIEAQIASVETATSAGWNVGGIVRDGSQGRMWAQADGIQADGTGTIAIGDYVVVGAPVARGVAQTGYPKVRKATSQTPGTFAWRVVSRGPVGTGAVGTAIVIEKV